MKLYSKKRKNPIKVLIIVALIAGVAFAISKQFVNRKIDDIVVAQIGEENIYKSEIERKLNEVFANNPSAKISFEKLPNQVLELLAKEVFLDKKIVAEAKKTGLDNSDEVKDAITSFKNNIIRQAYINNSLKDVINDQRIVEKFNEMSAEIENKSEYRYLQIVVKDKEKAEDLYKSLKAKKKPARFNDLAKKHSIEKSNEGDLDYKPESAIKKELLENLKSLKKDEISSPFQVEESWYIVKLLDIRKPKAIEFESAKEYIRHLIKIEEIEKINGKFIKDNKVKLLLKEENPSSLDADKKDADKNPENQSENQGQNSDASNEVRESENPQDAKQQDKVAGDKVEEQDKSGEGQGKVEEQNIQLEIDPNKQKN